MLHAQGVEVDNEGPAPENEEPSTAAEPDLPGEWVKESICPRRADSRISDNEGRWRDHKWSEIATMNELDLFRLCFPEEFFSDILIPQTNKYLKVPLDLQEWYCGLGCRFYMAHFQEVPKTMLW